MIVSNGWIKCGHNGGKYSMDKLNFPFEKKTALHLANHNN